MSSLQQINLTYVPTEDRLLLRVSGGNADEFRVWLTRRFTELLITALDRQMNLEGGLQELASSSRAVQSIKDGAFDQPYAPPGRVNFPLGEGGILGCRITVGKDAAGSINLKLLPEHGEGLNLALDRAMLYMLFNLLEQSLAHTSWQLALPQASNEPVH